MNSPVVRFSGNLKEAQFNRVQQALLPIWLRWYVVAPACLICFVQIGAGWVSVLQEPLLAVPDIFWALLVLAACSVIIKLGRRRAWKSYLRLHGSASGQLSADGLEWKTETSTTLLPWEKITGHRISRDLVLLYYAPRCAFFLPRSFLSDENKWLSVQQLLQAHSKLI